MNKKIYLQTERLIVRDHVMSDFDGYHKLVSHSKDMYYLPDIQTTSEAQSEQSLIAAIAQVGSTDRREYFFAMIEKATGEYIGEIGYTVTQFTPFGKLVHLGYFTASRFWGRGYVTEALKEVLKYAFNKNDVYRVTTGCLKENTGSERVMQKCGMIKEADFKQKEYHDGKLKDRVEYRLLKDEWQSI